MTKNTMIDEEAIRRLCQLLKETELTEIEYESGGVRLRVARNISAHLNPPVMTSISSPGTELLQEDPLTHPGVFKSPMVGTVYCAPEPGAPAFMTVGEQVSQGQTLLIIEAMKVMNPIKSPQSGTVKKIFFKDGQPVEYGEPLFIIES